MAKRKSELTAAEKKARGAVRALDLKSAPAAAVRRVVRGRAADPATQYAETIAAGKLPACKTHRLSCERHLADLASAGKHGWKWEPAIVDRTIKFFGNLKHSKGEWAGQPVKLEPWQVFSTATPLAWLQDSGLRRFRQTYEELPRKNGKSTKAAGTGLLLTFFDGEPAAEGYCAATKKDQARIVWEEMARMIRRSGLSGRLKVLDGAANISHAGSASKLEALGADSDSLDGLNIHCAIIDELHAHRNRGVVDVIETALGARRQPYINYITTAGYDRQSVCWEVREYCRRVLEGVINDPSFFAFMTGIDEGDDWQSPEAHRKANPNYGVSIYPRDLEALVAKAIEAPGAQNVFKQKRLNVWTEQSDRWLDLSVYDRNVGRVNWSELHGRAAMAAIDLSVTGDLTAAALLVPVEGNKIAVQVKFWVPEHDLKAREDRDRVPYRQWIKDGWIAAIPGNVIDDVYIERQILEWSERFDLRRMHYDRYNAVSVINRLVGAGVECVPIGQGFLGMNTPTKYAEGAFLAGRFLLGSNPVLRWQFANMAVLYDPAGNVKPDKSEGKTRRRIDGMVTLIMGCDGLIRFEGDLEGSVYNTRDVLTLEVSRGQSREIEGSDPWDEF